MKPMGQWLQPVPSVEWQTNLTSGQTRKKFSAKNIEMTIFSMLGPQVPPPQ